MLHLAASVTIYVLKYELTTILVLLYLCIDLFHIDNAVVYIDGIKCHEF